MTLNTLKIVTFIPHQVDFQDVPFVLELARHHSCSSTMQVCPQTGFPVRPVPALRAGHPAIGQALLPLSCTSNYTKRTAQITAENQKLGSTVGQFFLGFFIGRPINSSKQMSIFFVYFYSPFVTEVV